MYNSENVATSSKIQTSDSNLDRVTGTSPSFPALNILSTCFQALDNRKQNVVILEKREILEMSPNLAWLPAQGQLELQHREQRTLNSVMCRSRYWSLGEVAGIYREREKGWQKSEWVCPMVLG